MYPKEIVLPLKAELTDNGFEDLQTSEAVESALQREGTTLVMINSVCGCSARSARPGTLAAVRGSAKKPNHLTTTFAGFDTDAVNTVREHLLPYPPSSPAVALFKDGKLVHMVERRDIQGKSAEIVANNLANAFEQYC